MKKCQYCKNLINKNSKVCEICGKKQLNVGILTTIFIILIFIFAIEVGISSNTNKEIETLNIGQTFSCDNFDITINSYDIKPRGTMIDSYSEISDPQWIGIIVNAKNTSDTEKSFSSTNFILINSNGEKINHSVLTYKIWGDYELFETANLIPNGEKTGYIQFSNNTEDTSNIQIEVSCGLWSSKKARYKLS